MSHKTEHQVQWAHNRDSNDQWSQAPPPATESPHFWPRHQLYGIVFIPQAVTEIIEKKSVNFLWKNIPRSVWCHVTLVWHWHCWPRGGGNCLYFLLGGGVLPKLSNPDSFTNPKKQFSIPYLRLVKLQVIIENGVCWLVENFVLSCYNHC